MEIDVEVIAVVEFLFPKRNLCLWRCSGCRGILRLFRILRFSGDSCYGGETVDDVIVFGRLCVLTKSAHGSAQEEKNK